MFLFFLCRNVQVHALHSSFSQEHAMCASTVSCISSDFWSNFVCLSVRLVAESGGEQETKSKQCTSEGVLQGTAFSVH